MDGNSAVANLPEALLPPRFVGGPVSSGELGTVLDAQREVENIAFCRTTVAVYALFRDRYGERESAFLASEPAAPIDFYAERRELSLAYSAVKAEVSASLRIGPAATDTAIDQSVGFIERLPRVFGLIGMNVISARGGQEALSRSRALTAAQALEFDERLADVLTADALLLTSLPALREAADRIVQEIDPVAAERRRKQAEEDRTLTIRPADDGMAAAYALLTAHEGRELAVRADECAETVCEGDPRTAPQRRSDALMMLVRGYITLGCRCEVPDCPWRDPRHHADGEDDAGTRIVVKYRTLVTVVVNEKTLTDPENQDAAYLVDHGPITAQHARDLAQRDDAVIRPFGQEAPEAATLDADVPEATASEADDAEAAAPEATDPEAVEPEVDSPHVASGAAGEPARRSPWFRLSGVDVAHRTPTAIQYAARCRRAGAVPPPTSALRESASSTQGTAVPARTSPPALPSPASPPAPTPPALTPRALVIARGSGGYRFSADQARFVALLQPRCVFPLCTRPASRCQRDHKREYDHVDPRRGGASTADNVQPLCLPHHQLKTAGIWTDAHLPDGRILWIGPTGRRIVVDPHGVILGLFPDLARIAWTKPGQGGRSPSTPRGPGGPTRLQREHARRETLRARHVETLRAERERARTSAVETRLAAIIAGTPPERVPPPDDEPPPF